MAIEQRTTSEEEWRPVDGCPLYEVSNLGRVRSLPRTFIRHEWRHQHEQIVHVGGHIVNGWVRRRAGVPMTVMVSVVKADGTREQMRVHRLVLGAFVGPCPDGMEGCHYDGDPTNNRIDNLRWDTHKANIADCVRHGRKTNPPTFSGETHHNATLTFDQVQQIRAIPPGRGVHARLARQYGTTQQTVFRIRAGRTRLAS